MEKHQLKSTILLVAVLFATSLFAQDWVKMMRDPSVNFKETQKAFEEYRANYIADYISSNKLASGAVVKVPGEKLFKRWEWFMIPRVSETGERFALDAVWNEMEKYRTDNPVATGIGGAGNWTVIGPLNTNSLAGAGRLNCIRVHPTNANTVFVGAPSGGLWVTTDGGTTWTTKTDQLPQVIGVSDIAFDPANANIMYIGTGDKDHGDNYSVGLLKSTDGGNTWSKTGLSFKLPDFRLIRRVLVDPSNGNNILVATSIGVFRSTNAGVAFTQVTSGDFYDMEYKPGASATVYVCGTSFMKSTNGGATWAASGTGLAAATSLCRMEMAVTAADPNIVYISAGLAAPAYGQDGFYRSTNSGTNFTKRSTPANMGTQQWYDLPVGASQTNAQEVMIGGQLPFLKSTDGGATWTTLSNNGSTSHVDYHDAIYTSGTTAYLTSDGGVWKTTNNGTNWTKLNNNLVISQIYGFGQSATNANLLTTGWQDNGTNRLSGTTWSQALGGDGMLTFISWNNDNNVWASQYNGSLYRSTSGGGSGSFNAMTGITGETCPWVTEFKEDPVTAGTVYAGCQNIWKATAGTFTKLGNVAGTSTVAITCMDVSPASNQVMWTAKGSALYKSTNGGAAWTLISSLPSGFITDIACHPTDVNKAWVTYSGFSNVNKVFMTSNQGTSWTNLSGSLPNIPINCIVVDKNGNNAVYIGTDVGVYYRDATMNVWQPFSNQLPNVVVTQLEIFYPGSKIRVSTFGRGMWESTLYQSGTYPPDANFSANTLYGCPGTGVQFSDYSSGQPTSWSWTFQGGNPATSTQQNPLVVYNAAGTYSVALTATNANGSDTHTMTGYIIISNSPQAAPTAASKNYCGPSAVTMNATPAAPGTVRWFNQASGGTVLGTGNSYTTPSISGNQTYYVDEAFPAGNADAVGELDNTIGAGAMFVANDVRGLIFDVTKPIVLNSVQVYCNTAGIRTIEILDANGNFVTDTTLNIAANPSALQTVTINRTLYPGTNYFIKFRGLVDCWRNSAGSLFPYTSSTNVVTITGTNAGSPGYYYYFYNWAFTEIVCNTGRTAVTLTDSCMATGMNDLFTSNEMSVYPNPNNGQFNLSFHVDNSDNYKIGITNAIGQTVYEEKLENFSGNYSRKIDIASYRKGVYILTVSNSKNQSVRRVLVD